MVPAFVEIAILIACFILFYVRDESLVELSHHMTALPVSFAPTTQTCALQAILSMNVFQEGHEGNVHFSNFSNSLWSLLVLLSTANFPDVMLDSFNHARSSVIFFVSFLIFGTYGLLYVLMSSVFSQFQLRIEGVQRGLEASRARSTREAYLALTALSSEDPR